MTTSRRIIVLFGLTLALILPDLGPTRFLPNVAGFDPAFVHEWFWWGLLAVVLFYVLLVEARPLSSIGFKRPGWGVLWAVPVGILLVAGIVAIYAVVFPALHLEANVNAGKAIMAQPFWFRFLLVTRAAFMEETLFRGYGIERLDELTGNRWLAGLLTWAAFTLAHLSTWGWAQLIVAGWGGLVLTALYLWRRNLPTNMLAHWITDAAGFLLPH
ncbi:MAG: CPBP family intramembrane metalloprotease [Proteobacteria bacterium]|nr:CPBP family intramembrane metalloprotease [Pseudomonadota bacterium]